MPVFMTSERAILKVFDDEMATREDPEFTQADLVRATEMENGSVKAGINALWRKGLIRGSRPPGENKRPVRYALTKSGKLALTGIDVVESLG